MREDFDWMKQPYDRSDAILNAEQIRVLEYSLRTTTDSLIARDTELRQLKEKHRNLEAERKVLNQACETFREWFVQHGLPAPVAEFPLSPMSSAIDEVDSSDSTWWAEILAKVRW